MRNAFLLFCVSQVLVWRFMSLPQAMSVSMAVQVFRCLPLYLTAYRPLYCGHGEITFMNTHGLFCHTEQAHTCFMMHKNVHEYYMSSASALNFSRKKRVGALITSGGTMTQNWIALTVPMMYEFTFPLGIDVIDKF